MPVVAISAHSRAENVTNIVLDHHLAVEQALTHLYSLGHRRIAFMRGPRAIPDSEFRWEAIQQVAQELDLKLDKGLAIRIDSAGWSMKDGHHPMAPEIGYIPMQALLQQTRDFTAIFCFNDIAAIGAIRALSDAGLSVPKESPSLDSTISSPQPIPCPRSPLSASPSPRWASAAPRSYSSESPTARARSHPKSSWLRS